MSGIFEVFVDDAGKYRFQLRSSAGEIIALSDAYASRSGVESAIDAVRHTALTALRRRPNRSRDQLTMRPRLDGCDFPACVGSDGGSVASIRLSNP